MAISPAPPRGIISFDPNFFRANFPHLNPFAGNRPIAMTPGRFHYAFANTLTPAQSAAAFEQHVVPESRNVPRSTLTRQGHQRPYTHPPLLFLAGDRDHLTPASMVRKNVAAYPASAGPIEFGEFIDRSHFICNEPGWEAVADHALDWVGRLSMS